MITSVVKVVAGGVVVAILLIGGLVVATTQGWSLPFGSRSESRDSQVIQAIERTQEVSLVSLSIQGIASQKTNATLFGKAIPGSTSSVFLQYTFKGKLGIDGAAAKVATVGQSAYRVTVPEFIFIGYDEPTFEVATEAGDFLSWTAPEPDKLKMVNEILDQKAQQKYLDSNQGVLKDQAKTFYTTLITTIDPAAVVTMEFAS
ncbi:hypothetical protein [Nostocoides sp. Soil756]|jgi:hypothetical protein|uniref:hypothetical protein n=1 Tax=Nostocoides sp. Soil756 TaxID=1736399 RepID=UPI0007009865|nr:hypothetical protein [Tetrasphaera sp. Soil756]KRE60386.1 hypothetical protein ASG78_14410 [Tetrasphaera sp. Soil756]